MHSDGQGGAGIVEPHVVRTAPPRSPTYGAVKATKPRRTMHRGRTWDEGTAKLWDGTTVKCYLDTTWGRRFYFEYGGAWYAASITRYEDRLSNELRFDLRDPDPDDR